MTLAAATDSRPAVDGLTRVTPTRRLAHHLRARHDEDCLARGLAVWATPDIVTWDELVARMFALDRQAGRATGRWLSADASQLLWQRVVGDDPELDPLLGVAGVARMAAQSWRRLHDYRIPFTALEEGASPESAAFARWCRRYLRLLDERGWVDEALAQQRVDPRSASPGVELVGFDRLTPLQEHLLERWTSAGLAVRRAAAPATAGRVQRVVCLDATAEVEAAARWAAALLDGRSDRRVAIVVPELGRRRAEVRRALERVLVPAAGRCGGPVPESRAYELAAARPLIEQPVVAAALDLLELFVRRPDLPALGRLLRDPFVAGAADEAAARARLDARLRRQADPGLALAGLGAMAAERGCPLLAAALDRGREVISHWPEKSPASVCSKYTLELLSAMGWPGAEPGSVEHQAAQRWRGLVSEFGGSDEITGRLSRRQVAGLLRDMAARVLFEPQELRAPLLVIDPDTCAGMRFDAAWVCGMDAVRWPPGASPDPLLPLAVQARHGLPQATAELAARQARAVFERLLCCADELMLSVAEMDDDAPLLPSPWLAGIDTAVSWRHWEEPLLAPAAYAARPALEAAADGEMPPVDAVEAGRGGARLLELQSACPFRAQAELRLGARALEEPDLGVDAAERGDMVHAVLAQVWSELGGHAALVALDAAQLQSRVHAAVGAALAERRRSADEVLQHLLEIEAGWLEARILELLAADRARAPFAIEAIEEARRARIGPLTLELRPDRVDRLADGTLAVIDYKTGASADVRSWLDERPRLPQLPAYVQALGPERVGAVAFARLRSGDTGYVGVARDAEAFPGLKVPGTRGGPRGVAGWDELQAQWRRRLEALATEHAAGDARLAPDPPRACQYCHLRALCRIAETTAAGTDEGGADE